MKDNLKFSSFRELFINKYIKEKKYEKVIELAENKISFYTHLKQELKIKEDWQSKSMFLQIILEENDLDEIMGYVRENPTSIDSYAEILKDKFKDEVIEIYIKYIKFEASRATNRNDYKNVCGIIKKYKKVAGKQSQIPIINELMALYRKKPAFLDELSRIK